MDSTMSSTRRDGRRTSGSSKARASRREPTSPASSPRTPSSAAGTNGKTKLEDLTDQFLKVWRTLKRTEWVEHTVITKRGWAQIKELQALGESPREVLKAFALAVRWAATQEDWTAGKRLSLENLGSNSKWVQYAEKAAMEAKPQRKQRRNVIAVGTPVTIHDGATHGVVDSIEGVFVIVRLPNGSLARVYPDEVQRSAFA